MALKLKTKCHLDQTMCKTWSMTGHQRPLPSSTERQPEIPPIIRDIHLWGRVCAHRSARYCQQFHTPSGFPQSHVAMRVTLHSGRNSQLRYPPGTAPHPLHNPPPPPTILLGLLQKIPWPPGHHTTQNNRTHQHFHLHPRASSDTAAAAVRPLTGTDRVLKVLRRYSWHTLFPLQWYEHRRSQTWIRVPA